MESERAGARKERRFKAKIGTAKKPAIVRVQTEKRGDEIVDFCNKSGWQVIVEIEPDKAEDISDVNRRMHGIGATRRGFKLLPR